MSGERDKPAFGDWRPEAKRPADSQSELESVAGSNTDDSSGLFKQIEFVRNYLNFADPAIILIHGAIAFIVAQILGFIAIKILRSAMTTVTSGNRSYQQGEGFATFLGGLSSLFEIGAAVLVVWAVARLLADAIRQK